MVGPYSNDNDVCAHKSFRESNVNDNDVGEVEWKDVGGHGEGKSHVFISVVKNR